MWLNVYTLTDAMERMAFLNILCDCVAGSVDDDDFMFLGGILTAQLNPTWTGTILSHTGFIPHTQTADDESGAV